MNNARIDTSDILSTLSSTAPSVPKLNSSLMVNTNSSLMADSQYLPQGKYTYNNATVPSTWHKDENTHNMSLNLFQALGYRHRPGSSRSTFVDFLAHPQISTILLILLNTNLSDRGEPPIDTDGISKLLHLLTSIAQGQSWSSTSNEPYFQNSLKAWINILRIKGDTSIDSLTVTSQFRAKYGRMEYFECVNKWFEESERLYFQHPERDAEEGTKEVGGVEPNYMANALVTALECCSWEARVRLRRSLLDLLAAPVATGGEMVFGMPRREKRERGDSGVGSDVSPAARGGGYTSIDVSPQRGRERGVYDATPPPAF